MLLLSHLPPRLEGAKAWPFVIRLCTSTFTSFTVNFIKLCKKINKNTSNDISWYQLISHPCPSTLHKHCKHSAMLWHSLDALALWAFRACDWETLALMQSLIISYLLNLFLSHRHADRFVLQTSKEALGSYQRFCESPQKRLNKYTSTVIYRDMPWYAVIQDGLAYQIWPPDRLGAQVRKPKHQVWSNICRTSAGWHWTKNDSVGISMASAAYAHEIRMYLDISWYF